MDLLNNIIAFLNCPLFIHPCLNVFLTPLGFWNNIELRLFYHGLNVSRARVPWLPCCKVTHWSFRRQEQTCPSLAKSRAPPQSLNSMFWKRGVVGMISKHYEAGHGSVPSRPLLLGFSFFGGRALASERGFGGLGFAYVHFRALLYFLVFF